MTTSPVVSPAVTHTATPVVPGDRHATLVVEAVALLRDGRSLSQVREALAACNKARCTPPLADEAVKDALLTAWRRATATALDAEGVLALLHVEYDPPVIEEVGSGDDEALLVHDWASITVPGRGGVDVEGWRVCGWVAGRDLDGSALPGSATRWSVCDGDGNDSGLLVASVEGRTLRIGMARIDLDAALGDRYDLSGVDFDDLADRLSEVLADARAPVPEPDALAVVDELEPVEIAIGGDYVEDDDVPQVFAGTWGGSNLVVIDEVLYLDCDRDGVEQAAREVLDRRFASLAAAVEQAICERLRERD